MTYTPYFSYCPDAGFTPHETESEAISEAEASVDALSDGLIHEQIGEVCWGVICGVAECTSEVSTPGGEYDVIQTWAVREVEPSYHALRARAEKAEAELARLREGIERSEKWHAASESPGEPEGRLCVLWSDLAALLEVPHE
jgi:hypothetical protein